MLGHRFFLPGMFFAATAILLFLYIQGPPKKSAEQRRDGKVRYMELEQLKKGTLRKMELEEQQLRMEKRTGGRVIPQGEIDEPSFAEGEPSSAQHFGAKDVADPSNRYSETLDQKMDDFLAHRQQYEEMEKAHREAYVQAFIQEARNMGFEVTINKDMEITKVVKIGKGNKGR